MAYALGDPTAKLSGRLTLNPIPHIDLMGSIIVPGLLLLSSAGFLFGWAKPVPYNPYNLRNQRWGTLLVAVAGVLANFSIAIIFGLIIRFASPEMLLSPFMSIVEIVVILNLVLGIFNLIPVPPLDGSKVLFSLLPYKYHHIMETLERNWFIGIFVVILAAPTIVWPVLKLFFYLITGLSLG
jgi:Zn-dependent protease